jgi:N-acetylneuraminate synthase
MATVEMFGRLVGDGQPCLIICELGVNHQGSADVAVDMILAARQAGADVVKLQKRTPRLAVPLERQSLLRESCCAAPGELITELEHRERIELSPVAYSAFDMTCAAVGIPWFASPWDEPSVEFLEEFETPAYKIASASVTDLHLLRAVASTGKPVIMSTGMSTLDEVNCALLCLDESKTVLLHTCSAYPMENADANLRAMATLRNEFGLPVGYSGHERGLQVSLAAVAMGACIVERHFTLDRSMRGSDHAASLEPKGFAELVRDIRVIEAAMGDGVKAPRPSEQAAIARLRKVTR